MVDEGEFGSVLITKGKYKGRLGYYDDDDMDVSPIMQTIIDNCENCDEAEDGWCDKHHKIVFKLYWKAVVYLGEPFKSECVMIKHANLKPVTSLEHERFKKNNPEFCQIAGIP